MKLEYLVLIILVIGFYYYEKKDYLEKKREEASLADLKAGDKILTRAGLIGEVLEIDGESCLIITGKEEKTSYLLIQKDSIKKILEK